MSSEDQSHGEAIEKFCGFTGATEERARSMLEACDWNLELAVNMHVDTEPSTSNHKRPSTSSTALQADSLPGPSTSQSNSNQHLNDSDSISDDDDLVKRSSTRPKQTARRGRAVYSHSANRPRPTMASTSAFHDDVRPPIAPIRQILNPNPLGYQAAPEVPNAARRYNTRTGAVHEVFDALRDFRAEAQWQESNLEGSGSGESSSAGLPGKVTLEDLFRPPLDLLFRGSLESVRECATTQNKWLLVNIQNGKEFACQKLNRDIWRHKNVKDIIRRHFIFWQVYHDSFEGQRYVQFYNVRGLPHVAIIDPRTGEQMKSWPTVEDHTSFCDSVIEFLKEHPSLDGTADANIMKKLRVRADEDEDDEEEDEEKVIPTRATLYDQSEEAQLAAAIAASLQEVQEVQEVDDTIEIDEDTVETFDLQDQIARDKELIERSPTRDDSKTRANLSHQKHAQPSKSAHQETKLDTSKPDTNNSPNGTPTATTADVLRVAAATKRPAKIEGPQCKIALRFPDGSSLVQSFSASEQLAAVRLFVQMEKSATSASTIEFIAPPNRKLTEPDMDETLDSLGLCPASRLEVKYNDD